MSRRLPVCDVCRDKPGQPRQQFAAAASLAPWIRVVCPHCVRAVGHRAEWERTHTRPPKNQRLLEQGTG